jgi:hypothetical protein
MLLVLDNKDPSKQLFSVLQVTWENTSLSRDALIKEIKAQGKWQEEVQTENNQTEPSTNSNLPLAFENVPFISPIWTLAALFVVFIQKKK